MKNTAVWIFWFLTTLVLIFSMQNPIYLIIFLLGLISLGYHLSEKDKKNIWLKQNLHFLATIIFVSVFINGLFTHSGKTVLFNFPDSWILIGGSVTLESLIYGAINGLNICAIFLLFRVLNSALSVKQLTRLIPRALYPIGMIISISLTFFPSIQRRIREIKEAQIIRGNPMKKIRDWLPILIPLLVSSLENGIILSESMTSRGFYTKKTKKTPIYPIIGLVIGAFSIFSGWIFSIYDYPAYCYLPLYFLGGVLILLLFKALNRQLKTTKYHQEKLSKKDFLFMGVNFFFAIIFGIFMILRDPTSLSYSPYPAISLPMIEFVPFFLTLLTFSPIPLIKYDHH